jgi:hypothetical protein
VGVAAFALCYGLALTFSRIGVFQYLDVLFDTDAAWFLRGFAEGRGTGTGWGARSLVHPNVANLINPPVRLLAALCSAVGACGAPTDIIRSNLALLISPLAAAGEAVFVFLIIRGLYQSDARATLVALLAIALLPTLVFGAIPESFALTGCAFAALFYLASRTAVGTPVHRGWWALVGVALTSITVTHVGLFGLTCAIVHSRPRWLTVAGCRDAARVSLVALGGTVAIALALGSVYGALNDYRTGIEQAADLRAPRQDLADRRWTDAAWKGVGLATSGAFRIVPKALGHTLAPPPAFIQGTTRGLTSVAGETSDRPVPSLHANYRFIPADWGTVVTLAALAGAAVAAAGSRGPQRLVFRLAIALVAANWAFHAVFGVEMFLYAKHWSVPMTILLAAWLEVRRPVAGAGIAIVTMLVLLAAGTAGRMLTHLVAALSGS